jgi:Protein of unknown function (DUF3309)
MGLILVIILILFLLGGFPQWGSYQGSNHFYGGGPYLGGGLGLVVLILIILLVVGRI